MTAILLNRRNQRKKLKLHQLRNRLFLTAMIVTRSQFLLKRRQSLSLPKNQLPLKKQLYLTVTTMMTISNLRRNQLQDLLLNQLLKRIYLKTAMMMMTCLNPPPNKQLLLSHRLQSPRRSKCSMTTILMRKISNHQ